MGQTIKVSNGILELKGSKLNYHLSSSNNIVGPEVEVNIPPVWEGANATDADFLPAQLNTNLPSYTPVTPGVLDGVYESEEKNVGNDFRLKPYGSRVFMSASDSNTGAQITLSLVSEIIVSGGIEGSYNTQEISLNDINVIFPDNATPGNTASYFIETSSNFEIHEDIQYSYVIKATDQHGRITVLDNPSCDDDAINHNDEYLLYNKIQIDNTPESPFIITQSDTVSISSSTTPNNNISEMEFNLGNEDSPNYNLIPAIYIKDRDRKPTFNSLIITDIKTNGDGFIPGLLYDLNLPSYVTKVSSSGGQDLSSLLVFSSSNEVANNETASARYFQLDLDPNLLPSKLSAKNSPYKLEISASDGSTTKTSSSIILNVNNLDPVWSPHDSLIQTSQKEIGSKLKELENYINSPYVFGSASDPGGDNVTLSFSLNPDTLGSTLVGDDFEYNAINNSTPTASYYLRTSSQFPEYPSNPMGDNANITFEITATDEVSSSPGTALITHTIRVDAPPQFSTNTFTVTKNESLAGDIDTSYPNSTDPDGGGIGGSCNLDTGSGFTITSNDSRVQSNWFSFTGNDAINGAAATFSIVTSSLFQRVDADITASLIVTASDDRFQEDHLTVDLRITNEDTIEEIVPQHNELAFLVAPGITGSTLYLGNPVVIASTAPQSNVYNNFISPLPSGYPSSKQLFTTDIPAKINNNTINGFNIKSFGNIADIDKSPQFTSGTMLNQAGTIILWWKINGGNPGSQKYWFGTDGQLEIRGPSTTNDTLTFDWGGGTAGTITNYFDNSFNGVSTNDFHQLAITWEGTDSGDRWDAYVNKTHAINNDTIAGVDYDSNIVKAGYIGYSPSQSPNSTAGDIDLAMMAYYQTNLSTSEITDFYHAFSGSFNH